MAWLTGWTRRRMKVVENLTISDYQMKLMVHKSGSGPDTYTDIYLGDHCRNDFADLRFTGPDQTTLLSYWIESITSGVATIWIKIPILVPINNIYIYYDNPIAISTSNGNATFVLFDTGSVTEVDPDSKITINPTNLTWSGLNPVALPMRNYTYKTIENLSGYIFDFEFMLTSGGSYAQNDAHVYVAGVGDATGSVCSQLNHIGTYLYYAPHCCGANLRIVQKTSGTESTTNAISISPGTLYYCRTTRIGATGTLNIFSNAVRTSNVAGSPVSMTVTSATLNNALPMSQSSAAYYVPCDTTDFYYNKNGGWSSGYVQNLRLRKYTSPEPTFGVSGNEELNITAIDPFTLSSNICTGPCSITAGATWQNLGGSSITFTPAILVDGTTIIYSTDITIPAGGTGSSFITTPTLSIGPHVICPYPN